MMDKASEELLGVGPTSVRKHNGPILFTWSTSRFIKSFLITTFIFAAVFVFWLPHLIATGQIKPHPLSPPSAVDWSSGPSKAPNAVCGVLDAAPLTKSPITNVWAGITAEDNEAVWKLLHEPSSGLNLTQGDNPGPKINDNYVFWIDAVPTNKSDVLRYLEGNGPAPEKYARVVIFEGGRPIPRSQEYMVGPLPVSSKTEIKELNYIYNGGSGGEVPFNARYFDGPRLETLVPLLDSTMADLGDITERLFDGAVYLGMLNNKSTIVPFPTAPSSFDGTKSFLNIVFTRPGQATFLSQIDFYLLVDCSGTDASHWHVRGFVTQGHFFSTAAELRAAFEAGQLVKQDMPDKDPDWTLVDYKPELGVRDLENRFAPQTVELGGKRYRLDPEEKYVEYMGWSFYISHSRSLGIMFFDIRFKGERILYELSLQEALAQYSGGQPRSASTVFHDTYYGLGNEMGILVEGFDCPFGSTFWNISRHQGNATKTNVNAICIFEADPGFPLSRHRTRDFFGPYGRHGLLNLGTVKGAALTVRAIATVGNYDYLFDYAFNIDGSIEVTVRASGYLMSSYNYKAHNGKWGPRIHRATQGSLHDHVLTWKADFDLVDTHNSLQVTELVAINQTQPWFPELGVFEQMQLNTSILPTEQRLSWGGNGAHMYAVVANATNQWGERRGYRIIPGRSNIQLTTTRSPFSLRNSEFAKTHLAVTRQHDTEPYANSVHNLNLPMRPQQDFAKFFDGESVDGEDLVVWFNLGMHHFTRAEDIPVTLFTEAVSSITFAPQNFFDRAQDGDLLNRRWVEANATTEELQYETYGVPLPQCRVELQEPIERMRAANLL